MTSYIGIREESVRGPAVEYLRQQLRQGKSLARLILEAVDFGHGDVVVLSAVALKPTEVTQFEWGHARRADISAQRVVIGEGAYTAYPTPSANGELAEAIYALLVGPRDMCLLENSLSQAGDPWLKRARSRLLFNGSEVYHALFSVDRDKTRIENAVREAQHPPVLVGAVGRVPSDMRADIASLSTVTTVELGELAKTVSCVFVRAYDGEGYVLWTRRSAPASGHGTSGPVSGAG